MANEQYTPYTLNKENLKSKLVNPKQFFYLITTNNRRNLNKHVKVWSMDRAGYPLLIAEGDYSSQSWKGGLYEAHNLIAKAMGYSIEDGYRLDDMEVLVTELL